MYYFIGLGFVIYSHATPYKTKTSLLIIQIRIAATAFGVALRSYYYYCYYYRESVPCNKCNFTDVIFLRQWSIVCVRCARYIHFSWSRSLPLTLCVLCASFYLLCQFMRIHKIRFGWLEQKQTFITHLYITKNVFLLSASFRRSSRSSRVSSSMWHLCVCCVHGMCRSRLFT